MNIDQLRGASGTLLPGARFNHDLTRFSMPTSTGIACYRGMRDERGQWKGTLVGIARDDEMAQRFLDGAYVDLKQISSSR